MTAALLQLADAANAFGISRDTLQSHLDAGDIPEAVWGFSGWEFPADALQVIAEREGWPLDLTGRRPSVDEIPTQLDRYISETVAAHAAVVLAKTQASAARAEALELGQQLESSNQRFEVEQRLRKDAEVRLAEVLADAQRIRTERDAALARIDEVRQELNYERSRSAHLHRELNGLYNRQVDIVSNMGPVGRWRFRSKPLTPHRVG